MMRPETVGEVRPRQAGTRHMGLNNWVGGAIRRVAGVAARMRDDARGNVAMMMAMCMPVVVMITLGGVDIHRAATVRVNLQDALDAAALAAARSPYTENVDIQRIGMATLKANLKAYPEITLREADTSFALNADDVVVAAAKVDVKAIVANIILPPYGSFMDDYMPVGAHSEVDRSSRNVEVALVLDVTGSMAGGRLTALKDAAKDLIDLVVQDVQTPFYSKVAIVPYSNSVNPGGYLTTVRGGVVGSVAITNAVVNLDSGQKSISSIARQRPAVITTSEDHGFKNGDVVWISGVRGISSLNNKAYYVANKSNRSFELYTIGGSRVDGRHFDDYDGHGKVQKCQSNDCSVTITTSSAHGLSNLDYVHLTDITGMTALNNKSYPVGNVTSTTFTIDIPDATTLNPYSGGGQSWCAQAGCTYFAFDNVNGDLQTHKVSGCVTERTGTNKYTEVSASSSHVGRHYPADATCLDDAILPLSSDRGALKGLIDDFDATGSTAGQIGIAWGWYMVSPNFNAIWPSGAAGAYNSARTLKAVVIMTDGEFNSPYCSGVISRDAGSGAGTNANKIDCAPDNADPFTQSRALCTAMKERNVVVFTVGFGISSTGSAAGVLRDCASGTSNFHMAQTADDLADAFNAIGKDITKLRISK